MQTLPAGVNGKRKHSMQPEFLGVAVSALMRGNTLDYPPMLSGNSAAATSTEISIYSPNGMSLCSSYGPNTPAAATGEVTSVALCLA